MRVPWPIVHRGSVQQQQQQQRSRHSVLDTLVVPAGRATTRRDTGGTRQELNAHRQQPARAAASDRSNSARARGRRPGTHAAMASLCRHSGGVWLGCVRGLRAGACLQQLASRRARAVHVVAARRARSPPGPWYSGKEEDRDGDAHARAGEGVPGHSDLAGGSRPADRRRVAVQLRSARARRHCQSWRYS